MTFAALFVSEKREKGKISLCFFAGDHWFPLRIKVKVPSTAKKTAALSPPCVGVAETGGEHCSPAVIYERYFIYISSTAPHNSNRRKKQSGDCSPLCFWKEKLLFSTSKNDSLILGIRIEFLECYTDLNLCAILLINCCRGYAAA